MSGCIAIIPARGGSGRIKKKNIREFHGKPIIAYSIETAKLSKLFSRIVVSTDSEEIAKVARLCGAQVYDRDPAFGRNEVGTQDVARECIDGLNYKGEYACVIYATTPLMEPRDLQWGFYILKAERKTNYVFSVTTRGACIADAGQWYFGRTAAFVFRRPLVEMYTRVYPIPDERVCDINTVDDWSRAEEMYAKLEEMERA